MNDQVAKYYGVKPEAVLGCRLIDEDGKYRILIDHGIGGVKVYHVAGSELIKEQEAESNVIDHDEPLPVPAAIDLGLDAYTVAELREMAKDAGISYSGKKKAELIDDLEEVDDAD